MKCKNCNEELSGKAKFCSNCGQKNIDKLTLKYILSQFVEDIFNVDSKVFRTLKFLAIKPGLLTKEYIDGKRAQYVPPVRLYIVLSVIFFFLISVIDFPDSTTQDSQESTEENGIIFNTNDSITNIPPAELKKMHHEGTLDQYLDSITEGENVVMEYFIKKSAKSKVEGDDFGDVFINQVSLFLLIFLPLLALLYATCFSGNKIGFVGHLIFNLHLNSFVLFSILIGLLVDWFIVNENIEIIWGLALLLFGQVYLIRAIMLFYNRKWWVAIYKYFLLLFGYMVLGVVFMIFVIISAIVVL